MSPRVRAKSIYFVTMGRVRVIEANGRECYGVVRGFHGEYLVQVGAPSEFCACQTMIGPYAAPTCSHREALRIAWRPGMIEEVNHATAERAP